MKISIDFRNFHKICVKNENKEKWKKHLILLLLA